MKRQFRGHWPVIRHGVSSLQMVHLQVGFPFISPHGSRVLLTRGEQHAVFVCCSTASHQGTEELCQRGSALSSIAPSARSVAISASVSPFTPVILSRS